jgi:prevent-host-death family protein
MEVDVVAETVGIRELKTHLSQYVKRVKAGATVVITEWGKPVGRIVPMAPSTGTRLQTLTESGLVAWSGRRLGLGAEPAQVRGDRTVADLLLEDRE